MINNIIETDDKPTTVNFLVVLDILSDLYLFNNNLSINEYIITLIIVQIIKKDKRPKFSIPYLVTGFVSYI